MNGLQPEHLDLLGFVDAVQAHIQNFEKTHHILCRFNVSNKEMVIPREDSLVLFRVLQESLINILKHASANRVTVNL